MNARRAAAYVAAGLILVVVAGVAMRHRSHRGAANAPALDPLPRRVTVEVLNAGGVPGAARVATLKLRGEGLDVVYFANSDSAGSARRGSVIIVRRGDTTGVARVRAVVGDAPVVVAADRTRLVDLSIILGRNFSAAPRN